MQFEEHLPLQLSVLAEPPVSVHKLCGKAGQGKTYYSLCCYTKRQGWESPDQAGMDSILTRHIGTTSACEQQLPS